MSFIQMVAEKQFLPLVEDLKIERILVHPDTELVSKYFIAGILLIDNQLTYTFKIFVHHSKRFVATGQCSVRRIPHSYHGRAAEPQLNYRTVFKREVYAASVLRI